VVVAIVPSATTPADLGRVPGMALGLLSAGIGPVAVPQTYLDASQGTRIDPHLYDSPLPPLGLHRARGRLAVPRSKWARVRSRAAAAPADIVPGLLGSALGRTGVPTQAAPRSATAALLGVDERGRIRIAGRKCDAIAVEHRTGGVPQSRREACPGLTVVRVGLPGVRRLRSRLRGRDLLVALAAPPPAPDRELPIGIAGAGFHGRLTSESTHTDGLLVSTDLAPTILRRFGVPVPSEVAGQTITAAGAADPGALEDLASRLAAVPEHRPQTLAVSLLGWTALALLGGLAGGRGGLRLSLRLLGCTVYYLPALLLLAAALEPGQIAETLILALGAPVLGALTLAVAGPWGGLAIASAISVGGYAIDVVAGSGFTSLSLIGPNPVGGTRFYGIGNELEAIIAVLVPIGVGAALTARRGRIDPSAAAAAFALVAGVAIAAFAPGRFGADVGAAVDLSIGAAVAAIVCLGAARGRAVLLVAAIPLVVVAALALVDLASGGDSHLTRSVLDAGGLHDLGQVAERRLRLSAQNFERYVGSPALWTAGAVIVIGLVGHRRVAGWFAGRRYAGAGFVGALAGAATAVLVNDSGGLVLMVATIPLLGAVAVAWATRPRRTPRLR
jgi:hypothetical protein